MLSCDNRSHLHVYLYIRNIIILSLFHHHHVSLCHTYRAIHLYAPTTSQCHQWSLTLLSGVETHSPVSHFCMLVLCMHLYIFCFLFVFLWKVNLPLIFLLGSCFTFKLTWKSVTFGMHMKMHSTSCCLELWLNWCKKFRNWSTLGHNSCVICCDCHWFDLCFRRMIHLFYSNQMKFPSLVHQQQRHSTQSHQVPHLTPSFVISSLVTS